MGCLAGHGRKSVSCALDCGCLAWEEVVRAGPGLHGVTMLCIVVPLVCPLSQEICPRTCCWPHQPSSSLAPMEPGKSSKTVWLHYTHIGQRYFYVFPSTQRAFICLELCCVARVATSYLVRQCKTGFLLKGSGKAINLDLTGASLGTCDPPPCHWTPECLSGPQGARPFNDIRPTG